MSEPIVLTPADRSTQLWHKLKTHYEARLATLRAQNDNDKGEAETAKQRGRIAEVREFLRLGEDQPQFEDTVPRIDAGPARQ